MTLCVCKEREKQGSHRTFPTLLQENTFMVINLHPFSIPRILPYEVICHMGERKLEEELQWFDTSGVLQFVMTQRVESFVPADLWAKTEHVLIRPKPDMDKV